MESALDRFHKYLETMKSAEGRERGRRARELVEELRSMGDVGGKALMQALAASHDSDERRAAARLLGTLQVPQAVPLLKEIIEKDETFSCAARRLGCVSADPSRALAVAHPPMAPTCFVR